MKTKAIEKINRDLDGLKGISIVKNKISVISHILGFYNKESIIYSLKNGLKLEILNTKKNRTIVLDLGEIFGEEIYFTPFSNKKMAVIDLGAHVGIYSLYAALKNKNAKIYAFEPDSDNFKQLCRNIKINKLEDRIFPFKKAISKENKKMNFYLHDRSSRAHSIFEKSKNKVVVNSINLSKIFKILKIKNCDILKVDIEGAEYEVLYNSPQTLNKINMIFIECHDYSNTRKDYNKEEMKKFLQNNGFKIADKRNGVIAAKK